MAFGVFELLKKRVIDFALWNVYGKRTCTAYVSTIINLSPEKKKKKEFTRNRPRNLQVLKKPISRRANKILIKTGSKEHR